MYDDNRALLVAGIFLFEMQLSVVWTFNNMPLIFFARQQYALYWRHVAGKVEYVYARIVEPARLALEVYSQTSSLASVLTKFFFGYIWKASLSIDHNLLSFPSSSSLS